MTTREWIEGSLKRPVWLAGFVVCLLALSATTAFNGHRWHSRTALLEQENLSLKLQKLSDAMEAQSQLFALRTRELAESDVVAQILLDRAGAPARLGLIDATPGVSRLLIVDPAQSVRASATLKANQWQQQTVDAKLLKFLNT